MRERSSATKTGRILNRKFLSNVWFAATKRKDVHCVWMNAWLSDVVDHREHKHVLKKSGHECL